MDDDDEFKSNYQKKIERLTAEIGDLKQRLELHRAEAAAAVMQRNQAERDTKTATEMARRLTAELDLHRWIPVEERLPDTNAFGDSENVLVIFAGSIWHSETLPMKPSVNIGRYSSRSEQWVTRSAYEGLAIVTHWQPLPERP